MLRYTLVLLLAAAPATLTNTDCSARPAVVPPVSQLSLRTGATINLTCHVSPPCAAAASFSWLLGLATGETLLLGTEAALVIREVSLHQAGELQCLVTRWAAVILRIL